MSLDDRLKMIIMGELEYKNYIKVLIYLDAIFIYGFL